MALIYRQTAKVVKPKTFITEIQDLDYQCCGVAKINGKTWFIENALPQEKVKCRVIDEKRQYGKASVLKHLIRSPQRIRPQCLIYSHCGGCQNQHLPIELQRQTKQQSLFRRLQGLQSQPIQLMPMISGEPWYYRRRIRLSLSFNPKSKQLEMGFRQKNSDNIVSVNHCPVATKGINRLLPKLQDFLSNWSQPKNLGHIELIEADNGIAMLVRHIKNLAEIDRTLLVDFSIQENLILFIQDDQKIHHIQGKYPHYCLNDGSLLQFDIRDFIQVNAALNRQMIEIATNWLNLTKSDHLLDLFCGMGNFTLPLSRLAQSAVGIEGVSEMVEKARQNARLNHCDNVEFYQANLDEPFSKQNWTDRRFNKILLDPPRSGAAFALNTLCQLQAETILYISCNPATLVRDAEILNQFGYQIKQTAMIDMFPQTGHLESITLFTLR
ncbi:23S rRNA (uracil(1939)-C(5))-methyltransferase RlmD [Rodentibacter caecimuris]|uniref:23S rRNA (uracil(1939)-C(5))-methyltransferase RlmD n=1 Tax=Rodentibacter caecimuris TaxID=1796644 RepID=A0ABX3KZ86_9PAST|nr:23S rRNA methyltransferase [Rodentibacter heylii]